MVSCKPTSLEMQEQRLGWDLGMRVRAGRAILLFGLPEMLSKPQAGLTPARLKENMALGDRHSCSFPWLVPVHWAGPSAPHSCCHCREKQLSRTNHTTRSPELLWHTTQLQPKGCCKLFSLLFQPRSSLAPSLPHKAAAEKQSWRREGPAQRL